MCEPLLVAVPLLDALKLREGHLVAARDQMHRDIETLRQAVRNLRTGLHEDIVRVHLKVAGIEL